MNELWRNLKIGDRVRVVTWPKDLHEDRMNEDTLRFYRWLIATKTVLTVYMIDEIGLPWGEHREIVNGLEEMEAIALNHGGLEIVD